MWLPCTETIFDRPPYAIKIQWKSRNVPWVPWAGSLWHKRAGLMTATPQFSHQTWSGPVWGQDCYQMLKDFSVESHLSAVAQLSDLWVEGDMSRLCSHWSSSNITVISLVESFIVMKYFHSDAPYWGHFLPFAGSFPTQRIYYREESLVEVNHLTAERDQLQAELQELQSKLNGH